MYNIENFKKLLDLMYEGVYFVDNNRKITFWNKSSERITGFSEEEVIGKYCYDNILKHIDNSGKEICFGGCPLHKTLENEKVNQVIVFLHHKYGHRIPVSIKTMPLYKNGLLIGAAEIFQDTSKKTYLKEQLEKYKNLTLIDTLTNLPNRRFTESHIKQKLKEYQDLNLNFAIAFLDIDHFKYINDTYGHNVGDDMLKMLSQTYVNAVRSNDFVGRWGGEEFIVVFSDCNKKVLFELIERIRILVENSTLMVDITEVKATISIGATMVAPEDDSKSIIKRVDQLMYQSKKNGRNRCTLG